MTLPDTTTALLILHERERQRRPKGVLQRTLLRTLTLAACLSADLDREEKPKRKKK